MIYRKKMQENLNMSKQTGQNEEKTKINAKVTKGMLNVFLGKAEESETMWKIVTLHSQVYFRMSV